MLSGRFDWKQPYRWRTNLRFILPGFFVLLLEKGRNCEEVGASHDWYNIDNGTSGCYHYQVRRDGQLWKVRSSKNFVTLSSVQAATCPITTYQLGVVVHGFATVPTGIPQLGWKSVTPGCRRISRTFCSSGLRCSGATCDFSDVPG